MNKQKKNYKRKSVISNFLIALIGIFIFLVIIFVLVKSKIITSPVTDTEIESEDILNDENNDKINNKESSIMKVSSYVFNVKKENTSSGYFSNLTGTNKRQLYVSLVLEEDNLIAYGGMTLNKFVITAFDSEVLETFTGVYEIDNNNNLILKFLTNTYNNYELPRSLNVYIGSDYAILDGNRLTKSDSIVKAYSNDSVSALPSVFGDAKLNFASLIIIEDNLSDFGVALQTKFLITGFNTETWDYYMGEAYENGSIINLKMKNYGLNTLNDIMPREVNVNKNSDGILIDNVQFE